MQNLTNWLQKAYYLNGGAKYRFFLSLSFSGFVFGFLMLFRPFGIHQMGNLLLPTALGFAGVTFVCMLFLNVVVPKIIPRFFVEEKWTVGKELIYSSLNVLLIGFANALYSIVTGLDEASVKVVLVFMIYTFSMAIFPITLSILYKESRARRRYELGSAQLNTAIEAPRVHAKQVITFEGQNAGEKLAIAVDEVLFLAAADNYVELHYLKDTAIQKKLFRNTLKVYEEQLSVEPQFWRCHKSYVINLDHVERVSGNAQGYRLHIKQSDLTVPVSRINNALLKEKLKHH